MAKKKKPNVTRIRNNACYVQARLREMACDFIDDGKYELVDYVLDTLGPVDDIIELSGGQK